MGQYFVVNHKKLGFVICFLVPIVWIVLLWDSKRIRKGLVLIIVTDIITISLTAIGGGFSESSDMTSTSLGLALMILAMAVYGVFIWFWWRYYSKCVEVLKLKNTNPESSS